jgi:hypothetical protein
LDGGGYSVYGDGVTGTESGSGDCDEAAGSAYVRWSYGVGVEDAGAEVIVGAAVAALVGDGEAKASCGR